jgi:rare lipoprotein A
MKVFFLGLFLIVGLTGISQTQSGKASFYADKFDGRPTASGEIYKHNLSTAAHRKLPFGTKVKVTNLENNKTAIVKINDRGPFIRGRIIDLSRSVAESLNIVDSGVSDVQIEVLDDSASVSNENAEYKAPSYTEEEKRASKTSTTTKKNISENFNSSSRSTDEIKEYYELNVNEVSPDFYGVQIASFEESDNLLRLSNRLKVSYNSEVLIQIKTFQGTKVYTVILGQFNNRRSAENFRDRINDKYPDSFIVDMTKKD